MAFSSAPEKDTYSTHRLPVVHNIRCLVPGANPNNNAVAGGGPGWLAGMKNLLPFADVTSGNLYATPRGAINAHEVVGSTTAICRGIYVWDKTSTNTYYFIVISDGSTSKVYTSTTGTEGSWTAVTTLGTDGVGPCRFTEYIDDTSTKKLIMVDGIEGYVFTSNAAGTKITDVDFPTPHIPFPVFLDGYVFLAKAGTGDIYNSDLNDPASWTAGSFISSELYPDDIQALVKINNYILAIGKEGSEYFYDAANATGSPLSRQEGAILPFGTLFPNTIASNKDSVYLFGSSSDGGASFKVIEGFTASDVDASELIGAITSFSGIRAFFFRQFGDLFYVLQTQGGEVNGPATGRGTWVYSVKHKIWSLFTSKYGDSTGQMWPVFYSAQGPATAYTSTYVGGHIDGTVFFGTLITSSQADIISGTTSYFTTDGYSFVIPAQNFGTNNIKTMSRVGVEYSRPAEDLFSDTPFQLRYSDNNYQWSTAREFAGYSSSSTDQFGFPFITQLGMFRRRTIMVEIPRTSIAMKIYAIEIDINKGQQ